LHKVMKYKFIRIMLKFLSFARDCEQKQAANTALITSD
jgi:hypothetical protein